MKKLNLEKEVWEGWRVKDFIESLSLEISWIYDNKSLQKPFVNKAELKKWCMYNQPYYKKYIPEVVEYFAEKYNVK